MPQNDLGLASIPESWGVAYTGVETELARPAQRASATEHVDVCRLIVTTRERPNEDQGPQDGTRSDRMDVTDTPEPLTWVGLDIICAFQIQAYQHKSALCRFPTSPASLRNTGFSALDDQREQAEAMWLASGPDPRPRVTKSGAPESHLDIRGVLVGLAGDSPAFSPSPIEYTERGSVIFDPRLMEVGQPYVHRFEGKWMFAVNSGRGYVDFLDVPSPPRVYWKFGSFWLWLCEWVQSKFS